MSRGGILTEKKTSDAQIKASRKWEEKNPDRKRYIRYRSNARTFVRHWAKKEDMEELLEIYKNENKNASEDENKNAKETEDDKD